MDGVRGERSHLTEGKLRPIEAQQLVQVGGGWGVGMAGARKGEASQATAAVDGLWLLLDPWGTLSP